MKNIFSKILIGVVMLSIFLAPVSATVKTNHHKLTLEKESSKALAQAPVNNWWFRWDTAFGLGGSGISGGHASPEACEAARVAKEAEGNGNTFTAGPCTQGEDPSGVFNGQVLAPADGYSLGCNLIDFSLAGCFAEFFYLIWEITAKLARLAGQVLDFFVYYSTDDTSYRATFVEKGWAVVRDIANLFFIIALIYVAIKTILDMGHSNSKKMVATIIIVALIINFSLFVTKVIIDSSNILAKIFYNNITPVDKNGAALSAETEGEKSISVGMIDKYDPQELITEEQYDEIGAGWFIFTTIILIMVTLYTAYVFLAVTLLFVARVVSLWISMIFSPIAFASYTMPFNIPSLGHSDWWEDLFKNAILAPLFIFFLYIIVLFLDVKNFISYDGTGDPFQKIMKVIIPFIITTGLLMKAKELAVKYSGEMGGAVMSAGKIVGGLAIGAATGGVALAGRATLGRLGSMVANSERLKIAESQGKFGAATLRNLGKSAASGSMDIRGIKIAGKDLSSTGMSVGKAQEGGFAKIRADKDEKRRKRAEELKVGPDEKLTKNLRIQEAEHQKLLKDGEVEFYDADGNKQKEKASIRLETVEAMMKSAREKSRDLNEKARIIDTTDKTKVDLRRAAIEKAQAMSANTPEEQQAKQTALAAAQAMDVSDAGKVAAKAIATAKAEEATIKLADLQGEKDSIKNATIFERSDGKIIDNSRATSTGEISHEAIKKVKEEAMDAEKSVELAEKAVTDASNQVTKAVANTAIAVNELNTATINQAKAKTDADNAKLAAFSNPGNVALEEASKAAIAKEIKATEALEKAKNKEAQAISAESKALADVDKANNTLTSAKDKARQRKERFEELNQIPEEKRGKSINAFEDTLIPNAENAINAENKERVSSYADYISKNKTNRTLNWISSMGQYSEAGTKETAHKLRMGVKLDSK